MKIKKDSAMTEKTFERKVFYRTFAVLAIPLVCQNVITISVNLADNIMLGAYRESALAGVAAVNQLQYLFQMLIVAFTEAMVLFLTQYWGEKRREPMAAITAHAMRAALLLSFLFFFAVSLFPSGVLRFFTDDGAIVREGTAYLAIIRWSYPFFAVTQVLLSRLRCVGHVRIAFILSLQTLGINVVLNYFLIFGRGGVPELGSRGAAVATLISRVLEVLTLFGYIYARREELQIRARDFLSFDRALLGDYLRVVRPMLVMQGLWGLNTAFQTAILGHMSSAAIAANSAASNLYLLVKSTAVGSMSAASVMTGQAVGEGDVARVRRQSREMQRLFVLTGLVMSVVLFFLRRPVLSLYDLEPETLVLADHFILILCVLNVFMAYMLPTNNGIIRGGGTVRFGVIVDLVSIWLIVMPLSLLAAFVFKASPEIVVFCLNSDQIFKCVPVFIMANYGSWIKKLTR